MVNGDEAGVQQYLTFILNGEEYGVDILRVQEIKGWDTVTPIPNTPCYIKGVINLRGAVVPIVDLRERFGLDNIEYGATTVVIVLKVISGDSDRTVGIVVDAVSDVHNVGEEEMKPSPDFGNSIDTNFISGLATVNEKMVIIIDIDRLLNESSDF
ncbi:MAG: purine-binding chemotaxis protein CheW [Gammaproteobacteria bacterium]|nr:purine-binding chemotaxis protein CheW [Gammaproteobacteria bacterium]